MFDGVSLPDGYVLRRPAPADARIISELQIMVNEALVAEPWTSEEKVLNHMTTPGHSPEEDEALVVHERSGDLAACAGVVGDSPWTEFEMWTFVHPAHRDPGLEVFLLSLMEARAKQIVDERTDGAAAMLREGIWDVDQERERFLLAHDYTFVRTFYSMDIVMTEAPDLAIVPAGIGIRTFRVGQDEEAAWKADGETFSDHWGFVHPPLRAWCHELIDANPFFDPSLWYLSMDADQITGMVIAYEGSPEMPEGAWIEVVGVRPRWRGRGIAVALLQTVFTELYARGVRRVALGVDSQNETGATRLYERVGMSPYRRSPFFEKQIS